MCFPEGVFVNDVVPGCVGALLEGVVVAVVGGVFFMLNEVEVAPMMRWVSLGRPPSSLSCLARRR